jgi:hypothetical protein
MLVKSVIEDIIKYLESKITDSSFILRDPVILENFVS